MNRNKWIAVAAGLAVVTVLLYGGSLAGLFSNHDNDATTMNDNMPTTGVMKQDESVGQGAGAAAGDTVTVNYVGTLTDGKVFDSSIDRHQPFTFTLGAGQVIRGWDEGLIGMKVGGKRKLTIAPDYGYGAQGIGPIPPNSTLVFEVEMISIQKGQ